LNNYIERIDLVKNSAIWQWANNCTSNVNGPWLAYIGSSNLCNNKCVVCAHSKSMRKVRDNMSFEVFKRIIDQLPTTVKKVYLMKQGEPFVNRDLEKFVKYLKTVRPEIFVSLHTNGISASKERVENVLPFINSMGISISAISAKVYKYVHQTDKFEQVVRNLKDIWGLLQKICKKKRPHIFINYVSQRANSSEKREDVINYYKTNFPELSSVDFHFVYNFQGEIEEGDINIYNILEHKYFPACVFPWSSITFCYDGKVSYCFVEPRENRFLGDITTQSFDEIWNGGEYKAFRQRMIMHNLSDLASDDFYCHKCSWLWTMKSQSPRNLTSGYTINKSFPFKNIFFGDLLEIDSEQLFDMGVNAYMAGEIQDGISIFNLLQHTSQNDILNKFALQMIGECNKVLDKYSYNGLWQQALKKHGANAIIHRKNEYNPIR
jgi:MoaA/NifB/PqqE/SkfB family radical SAM enzyme